MSPGDSDPRLTPLVEEPEPEGRNEDLLSGTRLGKYEVLRRISIGGMAEIFLARAAALPGFKKLVVIKRILPQLAKKAEFLDMFMDEARIAATLQHPNIVQTYDVAVAGGNYFIAMEFLHGEDLHSLLRTVKRLNQRVPVEHALQIVISLCAGLQYAHEREDFDGKPLSIVHRDVTPANIIVTFEGSVKLLDFGIARAASRANQTRSGTLKGKIHYMSPEQAQGLAVDRRSDVYSAGILLYELTMMRRLYRGETDYQILHNIVNGTLPAPSELDPEYDKDLEVIVKKALLKDVNARYQTAQELQDDLENFARKRGVFLSPSSLKAYIGTLFGERINAWKQAVAEGKSLPEAAELVLDDYDDDPPEKAPASAAPAKRKLPVALLAGAAALLVAVAAVGAVAFWPRHEPPRAAPPPAVVLTRPAVVEAPPPPPAPPPPAEAPAALGSVRVVTHPHGAILTLDGKKLAQASNTLLSDLQAGDHTLIVEKKGYPAAQKRFNVTAGGETKLTVDLHVAATLAPPPPPAPPPAPAVLKGDGTVAITSSPWCNVEIDGAERGQTPLKLTLPAGNHKVVLSNPDYKIKRQLTVLVKPGETLRKSLEFAR
jgi:serine/threonine protein kinase